MPTLDTIQGEKERVDRIAARTPSKRRWSREGRGDSTAKCFAKPRKQYGRRLAAAKVDRPMRMVLASIGSSVE
jgi:hypothetical protein